MEADDDAPGLHDRSMIAGLRDRRASVEREKDFIGVFTPPFLPALDYRESNRLERASSAPTAVPQASNVEPQDDSGALERANSDSVMQAKPRRPSHLALVQRTSSSGSSADGRLGAVDGRLASAMKNAQRPKRKQRVSLAVGDAIVAPSDSVTLSLSQHSSSSHSRIRPAVADREIPTIKKQSTNAPEGRSVSLEPSLQIAEDVVLANAMAANDQGLSDRLSTAAILPSPKSSRSNRPSASTSKLDADGDLFDLEDEELPPNDPTYSEESIDDSEEPVQESGGEIIGRVNDATVTEGFEVEPGEERYDPTTGLVPEPVDGTDSAVPYLAFGPSSSVASQQPIQPGFRRPSVVYDPIYRGPDYQTVEREAVENERYGSSFNRPSSKGSFTAGSLGESYMAKHADEMMKLRHSKQQQTQVRS